MNLTFRQGDADDLSAVYELNRELFSERWSFEGLKDALESGYELLLCMDGDLLAGYLLSYDVLDEVHIMQIAVASFCRRRGIAEQLSRHLMANKINMRFLLEVRASNHAAQALYHKLGFEQSGIRKAYYVSQQDDGIREDAILMQYQ